MPDAPLRLLHASDFHLEQPVGGLEEVPPQVADLLRDAPYLAAERVFDKAIAEQVDFVVLSGDVVDIAAAGPRALAFLVAQFERLAEKQIAVYWAGGWAERRGPWPEGIDLPKNVHRFSRRPETVLHRRDGQPIAEIVGQSCTRRKAIDTARLAPGRGELYRVAVAYGRASRAALGPHAVGYWALGGRHQRRLLKVPGGLAHYPGSPQGRSPRNCGVHGCTLVAVDSAGATRARYLSTDAVRWHDVQLRVDDDTSAAQLAERLLQSGKDVLGAAVGAAVLARFQITADARLAHQLRHTSLAGDLVAQLRAAYGRLNPPLWTVEIGCHAGGELPEQFRDDDTVLGQYLATLAKYQSDDSLPLDLADYIPPTSLGGAFAQAGELDDPRLRSAVLSEAAQLGVDLLDADLAGAEELQS